MTIRELLEKFFGRVRVEILECREGGSKPAKSIAEFKNTSYTYLRDSLLDKEVSGWKLGYEDSRQYVYIYYDAENLDEKKVKKDEITDSITINFARLYDDVILPNKRSEDAGFDIYPYFPTEFMIINSHETKMIPTGLKSACDGGYYFQLFERGSTGTKGIAQRCGVIDSGYRGEWFIPITNTTDKPLYIVKENCSINISDEDAIIYPYEKAICQAVILPVPKVTVKELSVNEIENVASLRGKDCLGSSGK